MEITHQRVLEGEVFEAVRARSPLAGKQIIDLGSFSVLFEGETSASVYRLSSDNATHDFAAKAKKRGIQGVVQILADYGAVACYQNDGDSSDYLWLAHLERLDSLEKYPNQQAAVARLLRHLTDSDDGDLLATPEDKVDVLEKLGDAPIEPCTRDAVEAMQLLLPEYIAETNVDLDLGASNFMVCAVSGNVILSDPVTGLSNISEEHRKRLSAEGIVIEVRR
ncbi:MULTISPECIES: hypothetical protein [Pseudomonas chlororaphis group]|uniref:hypothetical protein n=1 Tax=Pseudomonas chlororaphis group TaxID=136842 RepID=UPI001595C1B2|nr:MULTISPECIES: hypothetical protein [Pseudomonas chlororaphis group]